MKIKIKNIISPLLFIVICLGVGYLSNILSGNNAKEVYASFANPGFFPPAWIFAPVWFVLYVLMGIAVSIIWEKKKNKNVDKQLGLFFLQLFVNFLWSIIFFGINNYLAALLLIILLFVLIVATMLSFEKESKKATYLLVPYMVWVGFAMILNYTVWFLYR